ncbi:MAG: O-antigen ligase family protein [Planctomycetes bacterium]|nr:O-antigen ligase family protein [Planctomycetota bacterium]
MWPLRTIGFFGIFGVACFASLANPIWGVLNYMMVYQINPPAKWWGQPLCDAGMRFSMFAAAFTIIGLFTGRKNVPDVRPVFSLWELGVFCLIGVAALNLVIGIDHGPGTMYAFEKFWKVLLFVLILARLATTRRNLLLVVWTLVLGSLYLGYDAFTAPESAFVLGRLERVGGPDISTTSGVAAHLAAMLPIIGVAFLTAREWKWKAVAALSGALTVNAIIMCRTRSAFIGIACGALAAVFMAPRVRRYRIHLLLILGGIAAFSLTDSNFWARMETMTSKEKLDKDAATVTRREIWSVSWQIFTDHPLGIGPGNFQNIIGEYAPKHHKRASHNSLVVCFVELGVQGGVLFLLMVGGSLWFLRRSSRRAHLTADPVETKILAYGLFISFVTYFITALGTQRFYCESFWWVLVLPLCLHRMVTREIETRDRAGYPMLR